MRIYFAPALVIFLLIACKDPIPPEPATAKDSTIDVLLSDTLTEPEPPQSTADTEDHLGRKPIVATVKQVLTHIPDGYYIIDTCSGDLNLDNYPDYLIVLAQNGEDSLAKIGGEDIKRRLLLLTGAADQTYTLAAQSDNVVLCAGCGGMMGDPYQTLVIKKGYFTVEHYGGSGERWALTTTFKYAPADSTWWLHKDGVESFLVAEPEKRIIEIRTAKDFGKVKFTEFDIYKDR
jgi:hypothetical protein